MASPQFDVLVKFRVDLESSLSGADLLKLSRDLYKNRVLLKVASYKFGCLDPDPDHLEPELKVRYLLQQVYERVKENENVYDRLIKVLSSLGGKVKALCGAIGRKVCKVTESVASGESVEDTELVDEDVPYLVEILVSGSHLWDAIGIALKLPKYKREDCGNKEDNVSKLSNILTIWILRSLEEDRPAMLSSLKEALASETVGLGKLAQALTTFKRFFHPLSDVKKARLTLEITYQSCDSKVTENNSTLLEVQVSCSEGVSYQWSKDGEPIVNGADFSDVCGNILYINRASQCTEGKYFCSVSQGSETVRSDEMILCVIYPPEKKQLLEYYSLTEGEVPRNSWPPVGISTFINLVLIRQKPVSICDYYTIRRDMDDILESKEVAEYEEVFSEYREGALVLVEGRPGSGKTTLVHKLTRDWASGKKVLQGAKMVFLVTLKLLEISEKDQSLLTILQIFYGENFSKNIEHKLQEGQGKGACFILDGLDEYPIKSKKKLIIDQLLFEQSFLPFSMVIVASRPIATEKSREHCKMRVEVVGFSKSQIYSYVRSYPFNDCPPTMTSKVIEFLDQHLNVLHMCYLPVHAAMICFLFKELDGNIPHRETQIYEQFTIATLLKHRKRKGEKCCLRSLKDLSGVEKKSFISICKLAFDMIVNSKQVVSKSDANVSQSLDSTLDLLSIERTFKFHGSQDYYTFSHLTFQEFLAAYYLHETKIKDEKLILKDSLRNVWKFYCGLVKPISNTAFVKKIISNSLDFSYKVQCAYESQQVELCDYVLEDEVVRVSGFFTVSIDLIALGYVISKTTKLLHKIVWYPFNCDHEGIRLFVSMATDKKLQSIKCLKVTNGNDEEFKALNYLLLHLPCLEELNMFRVSLNKSRAEYLASEVTLPHLKVLKLSISLVPLCSHPEQMLKQLTFNSKSMKQVFYSVPRDREFNLVWNKILRYVFGSQTSFMSWLHLYNIENCLSPSCERLSHCTEVVLVNCCIDDEGAEVLASTVNTSVLENFVLDFNRISDSGAVALAGCLTKCNVLQEVSIQCNCIGDSGAIALANAFIHCSGLRKLNLQGNSLGDKGAVAIAQASGSLPNFDLYLHNIKITDEGIEKVLEYISRARIRSIEFTSSWNSVSEGSIDALKRALYCGYLPSLKLSSSNISVVEKLVAEKECVKNVGEIECELFGESTVPTLCSIINNLSISLHLIELEWYSSISSDDEECLSKCLKNCTSLHSLTLRGKPHNKLPYCLMDALKYCSQLRSLSLFNGDISSYGVKLLFGNHEFWINLHTLKLVGHSIGLDGALVLSRTIINCKKLCSLDLSGNSIGDKGALAIAEGLKDCTGLLDLNVSCNDITSEGMTALSQVIKLDYIQHLNLSDNRIAKCVPILMNVICHDNLQTLELQSIELSVDGAVILSDGLRKCTQLVKLDVRGNDVGSDGVAHLAEGLQHCTKLQELDLSFNNITSDGVTFLWSILTSCKYLRRLNLTKASIVVEDVAALVCRWQHKSLLTLNISLCFDDPIRSVLWNGEKYSSSCDHLLKLYYDNDYVYIPDIPKLVSPKFL